MAFKVYSGTDLSKTYLGSNRVSNQGLFYPIVDPSSITSLQYWFDATQNTITTGGGDIITGISNSGNAGGGFTWYPGPATFTPATLPNFVKGTGDTKYYSFDCRDISGNMRIVYKSLKDNSITAQTVISISRILEPSSNQWSISWTSDPAVNSGNANAIQHPKDPNDTTMDMKISTSGGTDVITPDASIGSYISGSSDFTFFAATCTNGDWVNETDSIKFQSNLSNNTTTSQSNPYTFTSYYPIFTIHTSGTGYNPGAGNGRDDYAGVMVFDEVLDEETIGGIYRYYKETRGYSIV